MRHYPDLVKEKALQMLAGANTESVEAISRELGVKRSTLWSWKKKAFGSSRSAKVEVVWSKWDEVKKLEVLLEVAAFNEVKRGEFLRSHGLHNNHLQEWKEELMATVARTRGRPKKDPALAQAHEEIQQLKKDARRSERQERRYEKAMAEMAALLVLQKKIVQIGGWEEEEEEKQADLNDRKS